MDKKGGRRKEGEGISASVSYITLKGIGEDTELNVNVKGHMGGLGGGGRRGTDLIRQEKWLQLQGTEGILMMDMLDMLAAPMSKFWLLSYSDFCKICGH